MARIRSIHPGLTSDEAYMSMSMTAKAAWPVLWTECDDHGVFEWKPIVLKARIFPADNVDFAAVLEEYEKLGCVRRLEVDGKQYGYIHNFCKFQRPKNPSYRFTLPDCMRVFVADSSSPPPALPEDTPKPTEKPAQMKEGIGEKEDKKETSRAVAGATRSGSSEKFDAFWKAYPKRDGNNPKFPAQKKFNAAVKSGTDPDAIVSAAGRYADQIRSRGQEGTQFVAQAETWLNKRQWIDYGPPTLEQPAALEGFYAEDGSLELEAWDRHTRETTGIGIMKDRRGGWQVKSQWPPGYDPPQQTAPRTPAPGVLQ